MNVKGKNILITGGAGGLGTAMAEVLADNGANIYILDLPFMEEKANEICSMLREKGVEAYFEPIDGTVEEDWQRVVADILTKTDHIDVLVSNAGINIRKNVEEMTMEEWMKMMAVNTGGVFLGMKYIIPQFRKQGGGSFITTSSQCGLIGHKFTTEAYTATKGAVTLLTKSIASRYGHENIRANCICPSTVNTPMLAERLKDPAFKAERLGEVPLGRFATAEDVANSVLYLASEEASFINGVALPVDGGSTCD
ncbi:MAG: SDR family oxidoreductase [Lachnospiraceae bacterium]|nr:SDR family oxidoreductase [Lachnospiraceae bacterium]